jgi:hypothetical protein
MERMRSKGYGLGGLGRRKRREARGREAGSPKEGKRLLGWARLAGRRGERGLGLEGVLKIVFPLF